MSQDKGRIVPPVEIDPEAIKKAQAYIEEYYRGTERKDMEGWLRRFVVEVHNDPLNVLDHPPMSAQSDPDLLYYPARKHYPISALAYVHRPDPLIYVYEIIPRPPVSEVVNRDAADAKAVRKAVEAAKKGEGTQPYKKSGRLGTFKNVGFNKRRKS